MLFCVTKVVFGWILTLSMEGEEENCRKRKGKFRSYRRKKRKGFHGKKAWEMRRETSTDANHDASEESCKELQPSTSKGKSEYDDFLDRTAPKNMSELKLRNSSFNDLEDEVGISTRSQSSSSGMPQSMEEHEKAKASNCRMPNCFLSVSANRLFAAHVKIQNLNFSSFKKTLTVMALLNCCI